MQTFELDWKQLKGSRFASVMTQLAMVVNDLSSASLPYELTAPQQEGAALKYSDPTLRKVLGDERLRIGLRIYSVRMLIGHFCEGMKIIRELEKLEMAGDPQMLGYLARLQSQAAGDYAHFKRFWVDGSQEEQLYRDRMQKVRNSVSFHYGAQERHTSDTIARLSDTGHQPVTSFVQDNNFLTSRFCVADHVTAHMISEAVWGISSKDEQEANAKAEEYFEWCGEQCGRLCVVGYELCGLYFSDIPIDNAHNP